MRSILVSKRLTVIAVVLAAAMSSCHHVDNHRLPTPGANLMFWTQSEWITYGPTGAGDYRVFDMQKRLPANFPFRAGSLTGLGGVLLCTTFLGQPVAFDLSCPVECRRDITVFINDDYVAECPRCHSCYDVFSAAGAPISGEAAVKGYAMQIYNVGPGRNGEYMVVY